MSSLKDVHISQQTFFRSILPIGVLFRYVTVLSSRIRTPFLMQLYSGSLILSNTAYLYLSVSYIQMLKVGLIHCGNDAFAYRDTARPSTQSPSSSSLELELSDVGTPRTNPICVGSARDVACS